MLWVLSHFEFFPSGKFPEARFLVQDHGCLIVLGTCCDISLQGAVYFDDHIQGRVSFQSSEPVPAPEPSPYQTAPCALLVGEELRGSSWQPTVALGGQWVLGLGSAKPTQASPWEPTTWYARQTLARPQGPWDHVTWTLPCAGKLRASLPSGLKDEKPFIGLEGRESSRGKEEGVHKGPGY